MIHKRRICIYSICLVVSLVFIWGLTKKTETSISNKTMDTSQEEHGSKNIDAVSYEMELSLDTDENSLTETVVMEINNNTDKPVSELCLRDMTPEALKYCEENYSEENKNLETKIISIVSKNSNEQLKYKYGEYKSVLYVELTGENIIEPNESGFITVQMKTDIPNRGDRFGYRETEKGKLYALSFCFPYLADNEKGEWIIEPFFDDGESRSNDLADYSVKLKIPESYEVAMTGKEEKVNDIFITTAKDVRDFAIVACDFMEKESFEVEGIRVNNYYLAGEYAEEYKEITNAVAKDSLSVFSKQIGKYPYEEIDIVPCLFGFGYGGMEYPGLIMANASSYFDGPLRDAISLEDKISHEIAHQWFYAAVGNREYSEGWLDEGFTTLLEKDVYGLSACEAHDLVKRYEPSYPSIEEKEKYRTECLEDAREFYENIYLNVAPDKYPDEQYYGTAEYDGSYTFLQEVRVLLGDDIFMDFVRKYYEQFYMKIVKTEDVLKLLKEYNDSEEMDEIIKFYFR